MSHLEKTFDTEVNDLEMPVDGKLLMNESSESTGMIKPCFFDMGWTTSYLNSNSKQVDP